MRQVSRSNQKIATRLVRDRSLRHPMAEIIQTISIERRSRGYRRRRKGANFFDKRGERHFVPELAALASIYGEKLEGLKGKKILIVAGGHGELASFLNANFDTKAVVLDFDKENVGIGTKSELHDGVVGIGQKLPFEKDSFDVVVSSHFLLSGYGPVVENEEKMFREVGRVLKRAGHLVVTRTYTQDVGAELKERRIGGWKVTWENALADVPFLPGEGRQFGYVTSCALERKV